MAFEFPYDAAIDAVRAAAKTAWTIPDGHPIPESGSARIRFSDYALPLACIELGGEVAILDVGEAGPSKAVRNCESTFTLYVWLFRKATQKEDDLTLLRSDLRAFAQAIQADRRLAGTVSVAKIVAMDWSGKGRDYPMEMEPDTGLNAGYVGVQMVIEET